MSTLPRLSPQTVAVLRLLVQEPAKSRYGRDIGRETGLATGTLHPILARLERSGLIESHWEDPAEHESAGRPRRRYYRIAPGGAERVRHALAEHDAKPARGPLAPRLLHPQAEG